MEYRQLGRTDMKVSAISFGAWAIGGTWGPVDDEESMRALHAAVDAGVNFVDTADVYGDGRSERLVARLRRERKGERIFVATKAGRRLPKQTPEGYSRENLTAWVERSLRNLGMDAVDLLQLHCPHPDVYDMPEVFGILEDLVKDGKVRYYGISVETVDEALRGIRHGGVRTVQIIFNMLRLKPAEELFAAAWTRHVGILARVPLDEGGLTGALTPDTVFPPGDFRRGYFHGPRLAATCRRVEALKPVLLRGGVKTVAEGALRFCLSHPGVSTVIAGMRTARHLEANCRVSDGRLLPASQLRALAKHAWRRNYYTEWEKAD